jgi:hypothetical protein
MARHELEDLPEAVRLATEKRLPLNWYWLEGGTYRTVMSGYALYAVTGYRNSSRAIERRLYHTCDLKRAESLNSLLEGLLGDSTMRHLKRELADLAFDHEF